MQVQAPPGASAAKRKPRRHFRPDIEGLRAVAILGVVLFHAHVGAVRGGYVGVDVFFVVSGYLITGLLWRELQEKHRISLVTFYGRRARRLLPASILVIVVTAIAARHWLPPLDVNSVEKDGVASALYVGNYRFAFAQTNYLNSTSAPSPFQHYWSLGVEEQFYLLWPLLLFVGSLAWRYRPRYQHNRGPDPVSASTAIAALALLTAGSFALSLWLTHANQPWAFFSLPTRAWELGVGGLLALTAPAVARLPRAADRLAPTVGWAGLAAAVGSFFLISSKTQFPGTVALLPVLGTAAVLVAGQVQAAQERGPALVLGRTPMRVVGRISYSWYLWHWPFLILAPFVLGHVLSLGQNLLTAALSGLVATATFLLVEAPARDSGWLAAQPKRSLLTGGTLSAGGAVACLMVAVTLPTIAGHGLAPVAKIDTPSQPPATSPSAATGTHLAKTASPPTSVDPLAAAVSAINGQINAQVARSVGTMAVPANLTPSLEGAKSSNSPTFYDGCMDSYLDSSVENCAFGDVSSPTSVVLFGDSHAAMWFPAVDAAANQHQWRLYNWTKATCPPLENTPIYSPVLGRNFTECEQWRQNVLARIQQTHPALVILGVARHYTSVYGFTPYDQQWIQGMVQMISTIRQMGSTVVVIGPVPKPVNIVYDCLSQHLSDAVACTEPLGEAFNLAGAAAEKAAATQAGAFYIDTRPWFCTATTCTTMVGNIMVWRDDNHITETYSSFLGPAMSAELAESRSRE